MLFTSHIIFLSTPIVFFAQHNSSAYSAVIKNFKKSDGALCWPLPLNVTNYLNPPLFQTNVEEAPDAVDAEDIKKDVAIIFWSSGTTGENIV